MGWTPIGRSRDGLRRASYKEHDGGFEVWMSRVSDGAFLLAPEDIVSTKKDAIREDRKLLALSPRQVLERMDA